MPVEDLRETVWREIVDLFEGDENSARDWMSRPRIPLGHASPAEMLGCPEDIGRLRRLTSESSEELFPEFAEMADAKQIGTVFCEAPIFYTKGYGRQHQTL